VILIACGSRPHRPPQFNFDGGGIYDSTTFMHADCMPKSLAVVGAGPIGCEYACIMGLLDCSVTLIDASDTFLPFFDSEVATLLQQSLMETGIDLMAGTRLDRVSAGPPFTLALDNGRELNADAIVVAGGRIGDTDRLALENAGLTADARGLLTVNESFQTAQPHIRAVGDVIGFPALASSSMEQARLAMVHPWTPPAPQGVLVGWWQGVVLAAAIHAAFGCGLVAAGLDEIRKPAPDHANELEARGPSRVAPASVRPIMPSPRRSPSQLVEASVGCCYAAAR